MKIKAITLYNPWAFLVSLAGHPDPEIARLGKRIETRSWYTAYRGPLAIHAAKCISLEVEEICNTKPYQQAFAAVGIKYDGDIPLSRFLPCGAVLATCRLVDCLKIGKASLLKYHDGGRWGKKIPLPTGNELAFGDYTPGRYAWILEGVMALPEPIPAKGRQGLWTWVVPDGVRLP